MILPFILYTICCVGVFVFCLYLYSKEKRERIQLDEAWRLYYVRCDKLEKMREERRRRQ